MDLMLMGVGVVVLDSRHQVAQMVVTLVALGVFKLHQKPAYCWS